MDDLLIAVPYTEDQEIVQHLDAEILTAHLRRAGFRVSIQQGAPSRKKASAIYWCLPSRHEFHAFSRLSPGPRVSATGTEGACLQIAGSHFAGHHDVELLTRFSNLDAVVRGEAELPLTALLGSVRQKRDWRRVAGLTIRSPAGPVRNPGPSGLPDLDLLPPAADDLFHPKRHLVGQKVLFNRGCNSNCQYCGYQRLYRNEFPGRTRFWRSRSPGPIVDEIAFYKERHGVSYFLFNAAVFFGYDATGTDIVQQVAEDILRRGLEIRFQIITHPHHLVRNRQLLPLLERAGLDTVYLGADSGSRAALRRFRVEFDIDSTIEAFELLHTRRLTFTPGFIFYDPCMSLPEVGEQLRFLRRIAPCFRHMRPTYSWFLDRRLLHTELNITPFLPLAGKLAEDGLISASTALGESRTARFRDPGVARFHRLHRTVRRRHLCAMRKKLWDPKWIARHPEHRLLPVDLLEYLLHELTGNETADDDELLAGASQWLDRRLGESASATFAL